MLPHEMQALMAKILFFIFSILVLTMGRVNADTFSFDKISQKSQFQQIQKLH